MATKHKNKYSNTTLNLHPSIFNKQYFELTNATKPTIILYGGKGSGKSHSIVQYLLTECLNNKTRVLALRKVATSLVHSVVSTFKQQIKQWHLEGSINFNAQVNTFYFENGSEIICVGADSTEKLQSFASINIAWCEEAFEFTYEDIYDIDSRVRGVKEDMIIQVSDSASTTDNFVSNNQKYQLILSFNPISKNHWIYSHYFQNDEVKENCDFFHSTCLDNKFLKQEAIDKYDRLKKFDFNRWLVEYCGEFGNERKGLECYNHFGQQHLTDLKINYDLPIMLSFDDNVNPFISCLAIQSYKTDDITYIDIIDEICLQDYNVRMVCNEILSRYSQASKFFIYGDATSNKNSNVADYNFYEQIQAFLKSKNSQSRILTHNPNVNARIDFINNIFYDNDKIRIRINYKCKELIKDLEGLKYNANGVKEKKRKVNKTTGIASEEFGHVSDSMEYYFVSALSREFALFNGGSVFTMELKPRFKSRTTVKGLW